MIKYTKFLDSASKTMVTYFNESKTLQNDGMTFDYVTPEEAVAKSTTEVFIFWDNVPFGIGLVAAE